MSKITDLIGSMNDENASEVMEQIKAEAIAMENNNKRLYSRAKKAEGFDYDEGKKQWTKKEVKPAEPQTEHKKPNNEPDYARLAFLEQRKISHPDDQKLVFEEAERLKMPLTDILGMEHIKSKLKDASDQRAAIEGAPKGGGRHGGNTKNDVDYWLAKGETPDDQELAEKVIDARIKKEKSKQMFSDELFNGQE